MREKNKRKIVIICLSLKIKKGKEKMEKKKETKNANEIMAENLETLKEIKNEIETYLKNNDDMSYFDRHILYQLLLKMELRNDIGLYDLHLIASVTNQEFHLTIGGEKEALKWKK